MRRKNRMLGYQQIKKALDNREGEDIKVIDYPDLILLPAPHENDVRLRKTFNELKSLAEMYKCECPICAMGHKPTKR